ncbi:S9 family peptidase [Steroidobacter sp.]|uniref:S9 family peptidase n=1 Tax=Steroidobacter sp. TaxID=1978227 RepID=UPI001A59FB7C|nr:S9 family peptidase [Steroidobacter sp.]MBL8267529.1 S9 family peptidase [Steroidobacter sp.]
MYRIPCRAVLLGWLSVVLLVLGSSPTAIARPLALSDLDAQIGLSEARISPDGKQVALVTSRQDFVDNRHVSSLLLVSVETGAQKYLVLGRTGVSRPRWSPSGDRLAWLDAASDGRSQIYVMQVGSANASARAITNASGGVNDFRWSPDGSSLAFLSVDDEIAREGEERHNKSFEAGEGEYLSTSAPRPSHLWLISANSGTAKRLTSGSFSVTGLQWQEGGRSIAFISQPSAHLAANLHASLNILNLSDGSQRTVIAAPKVGESAVKRLWSPPYDDTVICYGRPRGAEPDYRPLGLYSIAASGGESRNLAPALDLDLWAEPVWLPGKLAAMSAMRETSTKLWVQPWEGSPRHVDLGAIAQVDSLSASRNGALVFIGSEPQRGRELYVMASIQAKPNRLTGFNDALAALDLGQVDTVSWTLDGFEQQGVLNYPPGFERGKKYPLVLLVHGGPMSASTVALGDFEGGQSQLLAANGWLVFRPNYRGSGSNGMKFQTAILNDAGDGPGRDVMAGVEMLKARGIVDTQRMAVSGWSYGGYMTVWLAAHYPVWRAAVAGAAVTDLLDQYNLSDENVWSGHGMNGSPWLNDNAANYWRQSPMAYAHRIQAPTLILGNSGDPRVTISQSYKLYHALKDNGVRTQFIVYPISGHWPEDPVHQRDIYRRWADWIQARFQEAER